MDAANLPGLVALAIQTLLIVSLPALLPALVIGVVVGVVQAATSINEPTISFLPKMAGVFLVLILSGGFILGALGDFMLRILAEIAMIGRAP